MFKCSNRTKPLSISKVERCNPTDTASDGEIHFYCSLAGTLLYLVHAVSPQACFVASKILQRFGYLRVSDVVEANDMIEEPLSFAILIKLVSSSDSKNINLSSFSDASHVGEREVYGQSGVLSGLQVFLSSR